MPSWHANWTDVRFNHASAHAAIDACRSVAAQIDVQSEQRARLAATAVEEWQGAYRVAFDTELRRMLREAADIASALRAFASRVEAASEQAIVEQRRREDDRARWTAENRRELAENPEPTRPMRGAY